MITPRSRRRAAAVALCVAAALIPAAATEAAPAPPSAAAASLRPVPVRPTPVEPAAAKPFEHCPAVADPMFAAADHSVEVDRITPVPSWRTDCKQLYRADSRRPELIFEQGFLPKAPLGGQYDVKKYVLVDQPSPFVSMSYDHDLYKRWSKNGFNYYVDAPGGIDVKKTIADPRIPAGAEEVAFPGGVSRERIVGACPVDEHKKTEIMSQCVDNPHYEPWRG
ncbi:ADP-ribosyltransferase [Streptomyces sp. NPDC088116]|uniref:ADP-ribosyltransferase n=1 Tax=Streptomyces sp. NPDC088116 TaxID=3365825 RepID=UPI003803C336